MNKNLLKEKIDFYLNGISLKNEADCWSYYESSISYDLKKGVFIYKNAWQKPTDIDENGEYEIIANESKKEIEISLNSNSFAEITNSIGEELENETKIKLYKWIDDIKFLLDNKKKINEIYKFNFNKEFEKLNKKQDDSYKLIKNIQKLQKEIKKYYFDEIIENEINTYKNELNEIKIDVKEIFDFIKISQNSQNFYSLFSLLFDNKIDKINSFNNKLKQIELKTKENLKKISIESEELFKLKQNVLDKKNEVMHFLEEEKNKIIKDKNLIFKKCKEDHKPSLKFESLIIDLFSLLEK